MNLHSIGIAKDTSRLTFLNIRKTGRMDVEVN